MLMLVILVLAASGFLLNSLNQSSGRLQQNLQTAAALAEAKKALLSHAIYLGFKDNPDPGYYSLPCPDRSVNLIEEGGADSDCSSVHKTTIGRLPWRTLGVPPLLDSSGQCLWYLLSGNQISAKINNNGVMMNRDTKGQLEIQSLAGNILAGTNPEDRAVAAIIAPGPALAGQSRIPLTNGVDHCGGNYTASNYLDSTNGIDNAAPSNIADAVTQLVSTNNSDEEINDHILWITRQDLAAAFSKREAFEDQDGESFEEKIDLLMKETALCLVNYDPGPSQLLPWAAPIQLADYRDDGSYTDQVNTHFGRLPFDIDGSDGTNGTDESATSSGNVLPTSLPLGTSCFASNQVENYRKNWKDHLFYVIAGDYAPDQTAPDCSTGDCLTVDGNGPYAAIIIFAGSSILSQVRNDSFPAADLDTKQTLSNYLEGRNLTNFPDSGGNLDYESEALPSINDQIFCIKPGDLGGGTPDGLCN